MFFITHNTNTNTYTFSLCVCVRVCSILMPGKNTHTAYTYMPHTTNDESHLTNIILFIHVQIKKAISQEVAKLRKRAESKHLCGGFLTRSLFLFFALSALVMHITLPTLSVLLLLRCVVVLCFITLWLCSGAESDSLLSADGSFS